MVRSAKEFAHDRCTSFAAAMSYYVLFSIFPLLLLVVGVGSLFVSDNSVRDELVDQISRVVVLSDEAEADLRDQLQRVAKGVGAIGILGLVGLMWSASLTMTALRAGLDVAWDVSRRRPFALGKLVDLIVVFLFSAVLIGSVVLTALGGSLLDVSGAVHPILVRGASILLPIVLSFVTFLVIYRVLPAVRTRVGDVWIGALAAALLFEVAKTGLTIYFSNFSNYNVVYGSLGAVISFLFFVWVSSNIILFGAEMASEWPRVRAGLYDDDSASDGRGEHDTLSKRLRSMLVFRRPVDERLSGKDASDRRP